MSSIDRKLERCAREIAEAKAKAEAPRNGLTLAVDDEVLPEDVDDKADGGFQACCCVCREWHDIDGPLSEIVAHTRRATFDGWYCCGSPRCCL